jgi:hypothetical protein
MSRLSLVLASLTVYLLGSLTVFAREVEGPGSGGGGGAIVCEDSEKNLKAELVDLVESTFYEKTVLSPKLAELPWRAQVDEATRRIAFVDPQFHQMLLDRLQLVLGIWDQALKETEGTNLIFPAPQDLSRGRLPPMPLGCQLVGAAVFNDSPTARTKLIVSSLVWNALPEMHKAGLVLHEAVYRTHRDIYRNLERGSVLDSSSTRALVGFMLSQELEDHSLTEPEQARFSRSETFRGLAIDGPVDPKKDPFGTKVRALVSPLLPYVIKGLDRPLFIEQRLLASEEFTVRVTDKDQALRKANACSLQQLTHAWPAKVKTTVLLPVAQEGKALVYRLRFSPDYKSFLESVKLVCPANGLHRYNPGFRVYLGSKEIAKVAASDRYELTGLDIKNKQAYDGSFLKNKAGK